MEAATRWPMRCIVMGAAGRDFHEVQTFFKARPELRVVAITAAQIPFIDRRAFPKELAGPAYETDIPIVPESMLPALIAEHDVDVVFLAYSDLSHAEVMHKASAVHACGASFAMLGPKHTQLRSRLPVVAVTAVRTGAGKSPLTLWLARALVRKKRRVAVLRHPMPYGDLRRQAVQRFASHADLAAHGCTIEEREEYEQYLEEEIPVYAGVDYRAVLSLAEQSADVVLWDGGNNDWPFVRPGLSIVVLDPLRAGDERGYWPGEVNVRTADVLVVNKISSATPEAVASVRRSAAATNPRALLVEGDLVVTLEPPESIRDRRVLVVEDGPTVTHGGMAYGAGTIAAKKYGAREIVDPRPFAVGTIADAYVTHAHLGKVLPALGYSEAQRAELVETIRRAGPDVVIVDASPSRLEVALSLDRPVARVRYRFEQRSGPALDALADSFVATVSTTGHPDPSVSRSSPDR